MNEQSETRRRGMLSLYGMWGGRDQDDAAFRDLLSLLWRRRWVAGATVVVVTFLTVVALLLTTPKYTSTALVLIEPRVNRVADSTSVLSNLPNDFETIQTELEVITSHGLLRKVVRELSLTRDPEFNGGLKPVWFGRRLLDALLRGDDRPPTQEELERGATDTLAAVTSATSNGRSRVLSVSVEAESPEKAARLSNAVADAYLVSQLDAKFEATQRTSVWLNKRLTELKEQVRRAEQAVEQYRQEAGLIEGKDSALSSADQMTTLSTQIVLAGTQRAEAEARLTNVRSLMNSADLQPQPDMVPGRVRSLLQGDIATKVVSLDDTGPSLVIGVSGNMIFHSGTAAPDQANSGVVRRIGAAAGSARGPVFLIAQRDPATPDLAAQRLAALGRQLDPWARERGQRLMSIITEPMGGGASAPPDDGIKIVLGKGVRSSSLDNDAYLLPQWY